MKIPSHIRQQFEATFRGKSVSRKDVENFLRPYFKFDIEAAYNKALTREALSFLASIKNDRQIREWMSFEANGQIAFAYLDGLTKSSDLPILRSMKSRYEKQIEGLIRAKEKIEAQIWIAEHQLTIYDFMPGRDEQQIQAH